MTRRKINLGNEAGRNEDLFQKLVLCPLNFRSVKHDEDDVGFLVRCAGRPCDQHQDSKDCKKNRGDFHGVLHSLSPLHNSLLPMLPCHFPSPWKTIFEGPQQLSNMSPELESPELPTGKRLPIFQYSEPPAGVLFWPLPARRAGAGRQRNTCKCSAHRSWSPSRFSGRSRSPRC